MSSKDILKEALESLCKKWLDDIRSGNISSSSEKNFLDFCEKNGVSLEVEGGDVASWMEKLRREASKDFDKVQ